MNQNQIIDSLKANGWTQDADGNWVNDALTDQKFGSIEDVVCACIDHSHGPDQADALAALFAAIGQGPEGEDEQQAA